MKKQLIILIAVITAFTITLLTYLSDDDNHLSNEEARNFSINNIGSITKIILADTKGEKTTLEAINGNWMVNNTFFARKKRIEQLLTAAKNVRVQQKVPANKQDRILKNLATYNIQAAFYSGNKLVKTYFVGTANGKTTGTYMLRIDEKTGENYATAFVTHLLGFEGYLTPRYEPQISSWRDLTVFNYPQLNIDALKVDYPTSPQNNFEIKLNNNKYELFSNNIPKPCDQAALKKYLLNFKNISAERLVSKEKCDTLKKRYALQKPWFNITIINNKEVPTTLKAYRIKLPDGSKNSAGLPLLYDPDRFHGICFNGELAVFQYFVFDQLLDQPCF